MNEADKQKRAAYMRAYYADPAHPERLEKKRECARKSQRKWRENPENYKDLEYKERVRIIQNLSKIDMRGRPRKHLPLEKELLCGDMV
jgi:hypothetical protein